MTNARLEELRTKFQENPRRYFAPYANELRKSGDATQAIAVCRTQLASQPGHVSGHIVLGQALYEAGESAEARDVFSTALELDPENLIALRTLGEISQVAGDFQTARQWYERLLDADPRNSDVVQLLKDMPIGAAAATPAAPALDDSPPPLPDGATAAVEQEAVPAVTFHTSFSGSGPAYQSDEPEADSVVEEPSSATSSSGQAEPGAGAASEPSTVEVPPVAASEPSIVEVPPDAAAPVAAELEMLDLDEFAPVEPTAIATTDRDEATGAPIESAPPAQFSADLALAGPDPAPKDSAMAEAHEAHNEEPGTEFVAALPEPEPAQETPRALFAERGFDGPADDDYSWMTTPSAALSDLESAPEDWFDDPIPEVEEASEPATAAMSAPDPATTSWFEEVDSGATIEATEVASDEFWLPPDLSQLQSAAPAPMEPPSEETEPSTEPAIEPIVSAHEDEVEYAATSSHETHGESGTIGEVPVAESGDDAMLVQPVESAALEKDDQSRPLAPPVSATDYETEQPDAVWAQASEPAAVDSSDHSDVPDSVAEWSPSIPDATPTMDDHSDVHEAVSEWSPTVQEPMAPAEAEPLSEWSAPASELDPETATVEDEEEAQPSQAMGESTPWSGETATAQSSLPRDANAPQPAPFVTETLADLYLQQGFREEALAIYRQLAARSPADEALRARVEALEKDEGTVAASADLASAHPADSQSVRAFFSRLARRTAMEPGDSSTAVPGNGPAQNPEVPFAAAASALANLFAASKPPAVDEGAAATLANAFTDPAGRPSRAAERELSLDHLFRDVPPGESPTGVTLDEFYSSQDASPVSPTEPGEAETPEPGGTDIRQFTAWLEGLRKK